MHITPKNKMIALTMMGIILMTGITFTLLTITGRTDPVKTPETMLQPQQENGYSASGPTAPRKDSAGNITCEANPDKKGLIIETVLTDEEGNPRKVNAQC